MTRKGGRHITLEDLGTQATRVQSVLGQVRATMLAPEARKTAPRISTPLLATLCGVERTRIDYQIKKGELPPGTMKTGRREFSLAETRTWTSAMRTHRMRPQGADGVTISVGNFKGGVSKTTTAITLAQGLSLRGHKVLVIDVDPQGSLTTLFGVLPDMDVQPEHTILPLCLGKAEDLSQAIRPTYWDGIDLVAAAPFLFSAEFALPARQSAAKNFEFWNVLHHGIDTHRADYDVIIIDTPPALSYTTINAFMASDGIIMPLPPNALDFASSAQFWDLFDDLSQQLLSARGKTKAFAFLDVLLSRVDSSDETSSVVREWIGAAYAERVLPVEIPKTAATPSAAAEFGTIYDTNTSVSRRTHQRAFDAYERFVELVEDQMVKFWREETEI